MSKLEEAKEFMEKAHSGQTRWDEVTPYSVHPIEVVRILQSFGVYDTDVLSAGYLHDVVEDTECEIGDIRERFGNEVAEFVDELTFIQDGDDELYWEQCETMSRNTSLIKIADILANLAGDGKSKHFIEKRTKALELLVKNII